MKSRDYFLFPAFCFLISFQAFAQDNQKLKIDTLLSKLASSKEDSNKVNLYEQIVTSYLDYRNEEGLKYAKPALELAMKINWKIGIARINYKVGRINWRMGNFDEALKNHFEALRLYTELGNEDAEAILLTSIGQDYGDGGRYAQALIYLNKALRKYEELNDKAGRANIYSLLSWVYDSKGNYAESSECNIAALRIFEEIDDKGGIAVATSNLGEDYIKLGNYPEAIKYLNRSIKLLQLERDMGNEGLSYIDLGITYSKMGDYSEALRKYSDALKIASDIKDKTLSATAFLGIGEVYQKQGSHTVALKYYLKSVELFKSLSNFQQLASLYSKIGICFSYLKKYDDAGKYYEMAFALSKDLKSNVSFLDYYHGREYLDSVTGNWEGAYKNYKEYIIVHDSTFNNENINKMVSAQMQYEAEKKDAAEKAEQEKKHAVEKAEQEKKHAVEKAEQEKKDIRQRNIRNSISVGLSGAIVFLVVVYRQRNKIKASKKRSDELLLNILPGDVAEELKEKGSAEAKYFDAVTVMFTDFKGFTQISEKLTPTELVAEIDTCFKAFDDIISRNHIEKIKTIGDSYMCAGGLPVPNNTHAEDIVKAAIEMNSFMHDHFERRKIANKEVFEMRIGIHTGPVVAGIVGKKKFAYDIWGDTVNLASRMEASGESGKINISDTTYKLIKDKFKCISRGKIQAKNKGEIEMYFVE